MATKFGDSELIYSWMRNRNTLEFLGIWEQLHNPDFKGVEFDTFKKKAGLNSFTLTPTKRTCSTLPYSVKPPNNGAMKTRTLKATYANTPTYNNAGVSQY
jgi:hypothetical protein